jgi:hypothetical protein
MSDTFQGLLDAVASPHPAINKGKFGLHGRVGFGCEITQLEKKNRDEWMGLETTIHKIYLERLVNVIKTNTDLLKQSLRKLGELSTIEGGNAWLLLPPGGITSHPSLAAAVSSIEDPASVIDHSMQGTVI